MRSPIDRAGAAHLAVSTMALLGTWLVAMPFTLAFTHVPPALGFDVLVGTVTVVLAWRHARRRQSHASTGWLGALLGLTVAAVPPIIGFGADATIAISHLVTGIALVAASLLVMVLVPPAHPADPGEQPPSPDVTTQDGPGSRAAARPATADWREPRSFGIMLLLASIGLTALVGALIELEPGIWGWLVMIGGLIVVWVASVIVLVRPFEHDRDH